MTDGPRMPLYHFVTADLPSNTKAPELDDTHAAAALRGDAGWSGVDASAGAGVTEELVGLYSSYLVAVGFLPAPTSAAARQLPAAQLSEDQKKALMSVGGRGGSS
jgi:L-aminoadipate-semialdehyde dehydrogenase